MSSNSDIGLFEPAFIKSLIDPAIKSGPLYTPQEALQLALQVSSSGHPNWSNLKMPIRSHLNLAALEILLQDYTDDWV